MIYNEYTRVAAQEEIKSYESRVAGCEHSRLWFCRPWNCRANNYLKGLPVEAGKYPTLSDVEMYSPWSGIWIHFLGNTITPYNRN